MPDGFDTCDNICNCYVDISLQAYTDGILFKFCRNISSIDIEDAAVVGREITSGNYTLFHQCYTVTSIHV